MSVSRVAVHPHEASEAPSTAAMNSRSGGAASATMRLEVGERTADDAQRIPRQAHPLGHVHPALLEEVQAAPMPIADVDGVRELH